MTSNSNKSVLSRQTEPNITTEESVNIASAVYREDPLQSSFPFLDDLRRKYSHQPTFLQAVEEMAISLQPLFQDEARGDFYTRAFLAIAEPERIISFRVSWMDDKGSLHFNRGWRVEYSR